MSANSTHAPRNSQEMKSFMEDFLGHFNELRKAAELPEVWAQIDALEDCRVWACVLAESDQPRVYVLTLHNPSEVEQEHKRHVADAQAKGELVWSLKGNGACKESCVRNAVWVKPLTYFPYGD